MLRKQPNAWRQRAMVVATILAIVLLASHPELRLLVPFVDALGIDLFVVLLGTQAWGYGRSCLAWLVRSWALPAGRRAYAAAIYLLGIAGPGIDAKLTQLAQPVARRAAAV